MQIYARGKFKMKKPFANGIERDSTTIVNNIMHIESWAEDNVYNTSQSRTLINNCLWTEEWR